MANDAPRVRWVLRSQRCGVFRHCHDDPTIAVRTLRPIRARFANPPAVRHAPTRARRLKAARAVMFRMTRARYRMIRRNHAVTAPIGVHRTLPVPNTMNARRIQSRSKKNRPFRRIPGVECSSSKNLGDEPFPGVASAHGVFAFRADLRGMGPWGEGPLSRPCRVGHAVAHRTPTGSQLAVVRSEAR